MMRVVLVSWVRCSAIKVQTNVFCGCLIVNYVIALHRTCYKIVCNAPWCPAVYKTSTALIQSIGFIVTGISICFSERLISFACAVQGFFLGGGGGGGWGCWKP